MLRLRVRRGQWRDHVAATADAYGPAMVPVVKGNGYGFGRPALFDVLSDGGLPTSHVCVGSLSEVDDVPLDITPVVLTPSLMAPFGDRPVVPTVGCVEHVGALDGWHGSVMVKLASSMRRYGASPAELPQLMSAVHSAGLGVAGFALHLPLDGTDEDRVAQVRTWLDVLAPIDDNTFELWVSHLSPAAFHPLAARAGRPMRIRVGTMLWHSVPRADFVRLDADVLQVHEVRAGDRVGYRHVEVPVDGHVVCVGAGSSHGIRPFDHATVDRRSPFHFARHRMTLLERPHMHTSMCVVPFGAPCPSVGDVVDVQQPLIDVHVDVVDWLP